ncbi:MAG: hypothetical protein ACKO85_05120 [Isosphaeraceae bacterium]
MAKLDIEMDNDATVSTQWDIVKDWNEQTRYETGKQENDAKDFIEAIEQGVLPWIKARW